MSNQPSTPTDGAFAQHVLENKQANLFLFDLQNEATERGFKDNPWTVQIVSEEEMAGLKRLYNPIVSLRLAPHSLLNVFKFIKGKLKQALTETELAVATADIGRSDKKYLAAYLTKITSR